jgi:hypothetical protein
MDLHIRPQRGHVSPIVQIQHVVDTDFVLMQAGLRAARAPSVGPAQAASFPIVPRSENIHATCAELVKLQHRLASRQRAAATWDFLLPNVSLK